MICIEVILCIVVSIMYVIFGLVSFLAYTNLFGIKVFVVVVVLVYFKVLRTNLVFLNVSAILNVEFAIFITKIICVNSASSIFGVIL
jgi:hypothetical protein